MDEIIRDRRSPPAPLPLTVLTGFLGAGKTTLLNQLLRDPGLADTVVIINEFGAIGLDHLLIEKLDGDMLLLTSGCLCCTVRGDLTARLEDLLRRRDNRRMTAFRRVVIETTGLADPAPILHTVMHHPYLALRYRLDGVVTLVDAVNGVATLDAHEEAVRQAAVADRLVVTKTDLCAGSAPGGGVALLLDRLRALNPAAPILDAAAGEATAEAVLDAGPFDPAGKVAQVAQWLRAEAYPQHGDDHGYGGHRAHDVNRHDARIRAFCLRHDTPIAPAAFDTFLQLLRVAHGPNLLRVKGIVALADDPQRPVVVHGVQHVFHPLVRLAGWPDGDRTSRMVFIVSEVAPAVVEGLWGAFTGQPAPDRADGVALADNPLALRPAGLLG